MKQCSKSENVLIIDSDYEEADGFIKGVREVTGEEWQVALHENNKIYGWRRYVRFFTVALQTVLSGKKYEGKTVLCWQQFYGIAIAFFQRMFHMKKRYKLVIMTFIYKEKRGLAGKLFYRFVRYAVTSRYVDKIILTTQSEKPMYQEIFGVEDDLFDFARCGAIAYEPEIYDDEQLREKNYIFSTGRSNRDYGFLIDCIQNTSYQLVIACDTLKTRSGDNIQILDNVFGDDMLRYMRRILILSVGSISMERGSIIQLCIRRMTRSIISTETLMENTVRQVLYLQRQTAARQVKYLIMLSCMVTI